MEVNFMLKVNCKQWKQTPQYLRKQALQAVHPRTRERYLALYEITQGKSAYQLSKEIGRRVHTLLGWIHNYNLRGDVALVYQQTGGHPPFFLLKKEMI